MPDGETAPGKSPWSWRAPVVVASGDACCTHCVRQAVFGWRDVDGRPWWLCAIHWAPIQRALSRDGRAAGGGLAPTAGHDSR